MGSYVFGFWNLESCIVLKIRDWFIAPVKTFFLGYTRIVSVNRIFFSHFQNCVHALTMSHFEIFYAAREIPGNLGIFNQFLVLSNYKAFSKSNYRRKKLQMSSQNYMFRPTTLQSAVKLRIQSNYFSYYQKKNLSSG